MADGPTWYATPFRNSSIKLSKITGGKIDENDIKEALELKGKKPCLCAVSYGLYLKKVKYK
ncbi:MAG: hypothetical protein HY769_08150 [Candidatus Stahlbacteria bacterium]|nr:hypothetical protein [Candidatus Stahlbacteria bacterium]